MPEKKFSPKTLRNFARVDATGKKEAALLRKKIKEMEDVYAIGLASSMGNDTDRFTTKSKSLLKRGITKALNILLERNEKALLSNAEYDKAKNRLIEIETILNRGGYD